MNTRSWCVTVRLIALALCTAPLAFAQQPTPGPEESFYNQSLHYTNRGLEYVFAKEQGGVERITGIPAAKVGCIQAKCHVRTCDTCHRKDVDGKATFSTEQARSQQACLKCHGVEKDDPDVHLRKGMKCMDCHSLREVHGDGVAWNTYQQPGMLDTTCEKCHAAIRKSASHSVHKGKLDCKACHVRDLPACLNCHMDTRIQDSKSVSLPMKNVLFLVNHDGKVTPANFLSYVYQDKTMITLAAFFPHSIMKEGRKCDACHNTSIVQDVKADRLQLAWWEKGEIKNVQGVVPAVDGMTWNLVFLRYDKGIWTPLVNPAKPLINYAPYTTPLTLEQLSKLEKPRGSR